MAAPNQNIKTLLLDGYLDEPSCLGVPPYISPHARYLYGALEAGGIPEEMIDYLTADSYRNIKDISKLEEYELIIILAGTTVPGHYLGGQPLSLAEIKELGQSLKYPTRVLAGPITLVWQDLPGSEILAENYDIITGELAPLEIYNRLKDQVNQPGIKINNKAEIASAISDWAITGSRIFKDHPGYPKLVAELETFRGCPRSKHCEFCSEQLKEIHYQRKPEAIRAEVKAIAATGVHNYRLGCQTDLLAYPWLEELYSGIREADPDLEVLHLDNINPGPLGRKDSTEARRLLNIICKYNTPGDVAAFGLESADPEVLKVNNIDTNPDLTFRAIERINEIGGQRVDGIPKLLPGLNFLAGLKGERKETYEYNLQYLRKIKEAGLMLRRINIRQVNPLGSYQASKVDSRRFKEFKRQVNEEINQPMLKQVFPRGTIIRGLWPEIKKGRLTYGRRPGSYPILVGIPGDHLNKDTLSVQVIDHGYRSITALPYPFYIDQASLIELEQIPGFGKKRAEKILLARPKSLQELSELIGSGFPLEDWQDIFKFSP